MGQNQKAILVAINWDQGGLIDPMGAEDVKCTGVENLAWGFNTPTPLPSTGTLQSVAMTLTCSDDSFMHV